MGKRGMNPTQAAQVRVKKGLTISNLQSQRIKKGLSQSELAKAANISIQSLRYYEQKLQPLENARLKTIIKICKALNCKVDDVIENEKVLNDLKQIK